MKILLPYSNQLGRGFNDSLITGGIEKFCHSIYDSFDGVKVLEINDPKDFNKNTTLIKNAAIKYNADIVICNWIQASFAGAKILDCPIPILLICHENSQMLSTLYKFRKLQNVGHSVCLVNPYQKMMYDKMANRINEAPIEFDGYTNSCCVSGDKPKLEDTEYDVGTIGRCDPRDKKIFIMKTLLKDTGIRSLIMSNRVEESSVCYSYYMKNQHWEDTMWDLKYDDVMSNLSKCKTFFQTHWNECFSITALEALSHGIPLILNTKNNIHSSNIIPAHPSHYKNITFNSKEELVDAIRSFDDVDRKEIQDMTWEKHSLENWKKQISNCIDKTIENFKNKNRGLKGFMA